MLRRAIVLIAGLLIIAAIFLFSWRPSTRATEFEPSPIRLRAATFTPAAGEAPSIAPDLTVAGYRDGARGYYIVQFAGPVEGQWKSKITELGGELLDYIPENAFKVRMNPTQAAAAAGQAGVVWVGVFQPAYKINPRIDLNAPNLLRVQIEREADAGQAAAAIARSGAAVLGREGDRLLVGAEPGQVQAIAHVLDVAWIVPYVLPEKNNDQGGGVIMGANIANNSGYDGSTQIAAVTDSGLGGGTAATAHPDIPAGRITSIFNWAGSPGGCFQTIFDDGAADVDSGHGTHTAVSVVGDGGPGGVGRGVAPAARLIFQATENWATSTSACQLNFGWPPAGYFLTGLPSNLNPLFQQAYNAGARVHSNSWSAPVDGDYTTQSADADQFIWANPDMTITFSAGNEGKDNNNNGIVDNDSLGSPSTAKNVITVGASENARADNFPCDTGLPYGANDMGGLTCASLGGHNSLGTWSQSGFAVPPLSNDPRAGNAEQMAPFSSRGPTDDGRIKPDVVAPGTWVLSGYSPLFRQGYGGSPNPQNGVHQYDGLGLPFNSDYKYLYGTSMSNPLVAGAATVVRDFYQKVYNHNASAALVKATLINSAVDLADENNDGINDNAFPIPNMHEGWGRVDVAAATDDSRLFADHATGIQTGQSLPFQAMVSTSGRPLKVTLVWSDYPSTAAAAKNLVNDLHLIVTSPGGVEYRGNVFSGGWSVTGGASDTVNNVENVYIQSAETGTWSFHIAGAAVPQGPQPFALVVEGAFADGPTATATTVPPVGGPNRLYLPVALDMGQSGPPPPPPSMTPTSPSSSPTPPSSSPTPTATATTLMPTSTPTATATTQSGAIINGNFEAGRGVGWIETSTNGWELVVNTLPLAPPSGAWAAWLGGDDNELSVIGQQVTIPAGQPILGYYHAIGSLDACGNDFAIVGVNGSPVRQYNLCQSTGTGDWVWQTFDLSAFAGQSVLLEFVVMTNSSASSSWLLDDIAFMSLAAAANQPDTRPAAGSGSVPWQKGH